METKYLGSVRQNAVVQIGVLLFSYVGPGLAVRTYADAYFVPSITLSAVHDDNIFVTAGDQDKDLIGRLSPALEAGFESPTFTMRGNYSRDVENYKDHSELNSNALREFADAEIDYQISSTALLYVNAEYMQSQVPSDLNVSSGIGVGRTEGDRISINPGLEYRFSETSTGVLEFFQTSENLANGIESDIDQVNTEFEHALSARNRMTYGYTYSEYEFTNGLLQRIHTPRIGWIHNYSALTTLEIAAGPRIEEGNVDANVSVILNHQYSAGRFSLRYDRDVTTLIGEAGVVQVETVGANLLHRVGSAWEFNLTPSFGKVSRPETLIADADIYRVGMDARYQVNPAFTLFASYSYSYQESRFENFDALEIPRNLFTLGMTLRLPRRNSTQASNR